MTKTSTRQRIIEEGARIVHLKGFNNTGIQEVLDAAGVPKGSFYFYFRNKQEFGLALVDYYMGHMLGWMVRHLHSPAPLPLARLRGFFQAVRDAFDRGELKGGCPIGNLAQEMGDLSPEFQARLKEAFEQMKTMIGQCIEEAQQQGEVGASLDPYDTADFIVNSWEGALLRMKTAGDTRPLQLFEKMVFSNVLRT